MRLEWTTQKFRREKPGQMVAITSQEVPNNCDNSDGRQRCCGRQAPPEHKQRLVPCDGSGNETKAALANTVITHN